MRFKRKELEKLLSKIRLWNLFGWKYRGNGLNDLKQYSSLNCGNMHCMCELFKKFEKHKRNKDQRKESKQIAIDGEIDYYDIKKDMELNELFYELL
jgi:hypothetical protein